jgi:hypothetical protein
MEGDMTRKRSTVERMEAGASQTVTFTDAEVRALLRSPEALQLVIDHRHVQEAEADAVGEFADFIKDSEERRKVLEAHRDRLLVERGRSPGELLIIDGYEQRRTAKGTSPVDERGGQLDIADGDTSPAI